MFISVERVKHVREIIPFGNTWFLSICAVDTSHYPKRRSTGATIRLIRHSPF